VALWGQSERRDPGLREVGESEGDGRDIDHADMARTDKRPGQDSKKKIPKYEKSPDCRDLDYPECRYTILKPV
jgi:hypothetical protein